MYKSTNYGKSWKDISGNIPYGAYTRVVREDNVGEGETETESYEMLDFSLKKTFVLNNQNEVSLSLFGKNLLDEVARNHSSFVKNEVPLPGRNYGLKLNYKF